MNVGQMVQKLKDLYAAAKAGNYLLAMSIAFEIIKAITDSMPTQDFAAPMPVHAASDDLDSLLEELNNFTPPVSAGMNAAAPTGPLAILLLPILQAVVKELLKKLIGL